MLWLFQIRLERQLVWACHPAKVVWDLAHMSRPMSIHSRQRSKAVCLGSDKILDKVNWSLQGYLVSLH